MTPAQYAPPTVAIAEFAGFGPALTLAIRVLRERASRARGIFVPTDADMADLAADELEELQHLLILPNLPD